MIDRRFLGEQTSGMHVLPLNVSVRGDSLAFPDVCAHTSSAAKRKFAS